MHVDPVIEALLRSGEPAIRYRVRTGALGEDPDASGMRALRAEIKASATVARLLQHRDGSGRITTPAHPYAKWQGAHWVLAALADIGYPAGDISLQPLCGQVQAHWLSNEFFQEFPATAKAAAYRHQGVPVMHGRHRRCASQQANALWSVLKLGLGDDRTHALVDRLLHWQWPDGGWNCDKNPAASHSSFMETILPLRALALYGRLTGHAAARRAAERAAEVFLERRLFLGRRDGRVIRAEFTSLHYPLYWHYDVLHGLKVLAEAGFIDDPRCRPALDLLMDKRLPDGGWPAERKYYRASGLVAHGNDYVDWGGTSRRQMNPWVTTDALFVLRAAGRLDAVAA